MTDTAGNSRTQSGFPVTVDNIAAAGSSVQTANKVGGVAGKAQTGDTITLTFTEAVDPASILAGWTGGSTSVTVRVTDLSNNRLTVWNSSNTTQLPLGTVYLGRGDYLYDDVSFTGSTMVQTGAAITITLGTPSPSFSVNTASGSGTMTWTPSSTATDAAGNAVSTTTVTESGSSDREF
jgi:hypothetical protein